MPIQTLHLSLWFCAHAKCYVKSGLTNVLKMPTKPKICIFFRFGLPTILSCRRLCSLSLPRVAAGWSVLCYWHFLVMSLVSCLFGLFSTKTISCADPEGRGHEEQTSTHPPEKSQRYMVSLQYWSRSPVKSTKLPS